MKIYVEDLIYTLLNNQNVSLCCQKSVELIKKSQDIYAIAKSEDTFIESIIQVEIYVA